MELFFITLVKAVVAQIVGVFGIFFVFGLILSKLQEWTHGVYRAGVGWKGILLTAWIGTPIHELGHVFFAKLFRHRIVSISLFKPNERTGGLGHVNHSYNEKNVYQKIGNFFIGAAPLIWGGIALGLLLYFCVPNGRDIFAATQIAPVSVTVVGQSIWNILQLLFSPENFHHWYFFAFLYVSFCVASHMAPSKEDRRGMWRGFFWLVCLVIIGNMLALLFKTDITRHILLVNRHLHTVVALCVYATLISFVHFMAASIILLPFKK